MKANGFTPFMIYGLSIYFQMSAFGYKRAFDMLEIHDSLSIIVLVLITMFSTMFTFLGIDEARDKK